ncbi:MAG: hypothetical protein JWO06_3133, partial [Bacteroidota bacterium]|nr:hypothetical protein [Bacteroidota bacterium]
MKKKFPLLLLVCALVICIDLKAQWNLGGNAIGSNSNVFGTTDTKDIIVQGNGYDVMTITGNQTSGNVGNVGIGMATSGTGPSATWPPQNKLLVENGDFISHIPSTYSLNLCSAGTPISTPVDPVTGIADAYSIFQIIGLSPANIGIYVASGHTVDDQGMPIFTYSLGNKYNEGHLSFVSEDATGHVGTGDGVHNESFSSSVTGNGTGDTFVTAENVGYHTDVQGCNGASNSGFNANVAGDDNNISLAGNVGADFWIDGNNSMNLGIYTQVGKNSTTAYDNTGISVNVQGSSTSNHGIDAQIMGTANGGSCIAIRGAIGTGADGTDNFGVVGDLSNLSPPSNTTNPYYSVYGIQSSASISGIGGLCCGPSGSTNPYGAVYAGYFEGDVFAGSTYYYSDPKLKENIKNYEGALEHLNKLPVKRYNFKNKQYPKMNMPYGEQIGLLSTDVKQVFPYLIKSGQHPGNKSRKDDQPVSFEAVNYVGLIPVLVEAVRELGLKTDTIKQNNTLADTVKEQRIELNSLAAQIGDMNKQIADLKNTLNDICNLGCGGLQGNNAQGISPDVVLYQSIPNPTSGSASIGYFINIPFTTAVIDVYSAGGVLIKEYKISEGGKGSIVLEGGQ